MRPAGRLDDYVRNPVGRYYAAGTFAHFFHDEQLCGLLLWGEPDVADVRRMTRAIDAELPDNSPVHSSIVDARRLVAVDLAAFEVLVAYFATRAAAIGENIVRHALVRPSGVIGAVVAGFWTVVPEATHPERTRVFSDMSGALGWIERPDAGALLEAMDALHAAATGTPRAVQALRDVLAARAGRASLGEVARELGVSSRTLQDHLQRAGTSFRSEANRARIASAQALLAGTHDNLTAIAMEVGCSSLQHFSALFRRLTGESPSAWRARHSRG